MSRPMWANDHRYWTQQVGLLGPMKPRTRTWSSTDLRGGVGGLIHTSKFALSAPVEKMLFSCNPDAALICKAKHGPSISKASDTAA